MNGEFREDPRFKQCNKETVVMLILLALNILWWYGFAYGLGSRPPAQYGYVMGLPDWFFWSCVAGYFVFSAAAYFAVKFFFKDIRLDDSGSASNGPEVKE